VVEATVKVALEEPEPPLMGLVPKVTVTPEGIPDAVSVTDELNPFDGVAAETSRALARSVHALRRMVRGISSGLTALAFSWGVVVMLIPERLGRALLKTSWDPGRQLAIPVIAFAIAAGFAQGPTIGLRALAAAKESLHARVITAPVVILGGLVGAITEGAAGAAWGLAIGNAARAAACFTFYKRAVIARERSLGAQVHELPADAVPHTHR